MRKDLSIDSAPPINKIFFPFRFKIDPLSQRYILSPNLKLMSSKLFIFLLLKVLNSLRYGLANLSEFFKFEILNCGYVSSKS